MKFTDPNNPSAPAVIVQAVDGCLQFGTDVLDNALPNGDVQHMLRLTLYPLPCDHSMIDAVLAAMNAAAIATLHDHGIGLSDNAMSHEGSPPDGTVQ